MDQPTSDLLSRWNLANYIETFSDQRIDIATMLMLPKEDICALIPNIGDRVRFQASLSMYRDDQRKASSSGYEAPAFNSTFLNDVLKEGQRTPEWTEDGCLLLLPPSGLDDVIELGSKGSQKSGADNTEDTTRSRESSVFESGRHNSVREVLETSAEGHQIIEIGLKTGALPPPIRVRLCKLLLETLVVVENPVLPTDAKLLSLSHDIGRLFIKESPPLYYAPYLPADAYQSKRNTSGWLVNARRARRTHLISLGLLAKPKTRSRSGSSSNKSDVTSLTTCGINLQELEEGDADKVVSALEQLSSHSAGPWQEVCTLWRETVRARLHYLYYKEGTLQQYFEKYPILQSPNGWRLLTADYDALFPDKASGLQTLEASVGTILEAARKKATTTKDKFLRQRIANTLNICDVNSETNTISAILLIGCLFNIPPARRSKKDWQASRAEILDGFVTIVNTEADVQVTVEERRQKLQKLHLTLQPFIIWCRESGATFTVCDSVLYKFSSLPEAVDATFKIFHATGAKYPTESYNIWLIIQIGLYNVRTSYDRMSQSVKETLFSLGLAL